MSNRKTPEEAWPLEPAQADELERRGYAVVRVGEVKRLREALVLAERALRDQPMQAFRTEAARRRRAEALDAAQKALGDAK